MHYERLLVLVSVAAFAISATLASLTLAAFGARILRAVETHPPRRRARLLVAIRLVPCLLGLLATVVVASTFIRYEPRDTTEEPGLVLLMLAGCALSVILAAAVRLTAAAWRTGKCHRLVDRHGQRIEVAGFPLPVWSIAARFPVAAASGVLRPRLILSSRILEECSADELLTVLRHELSHLRRHDNLIRAAWIALPDVFAFTRTGRELSNRWHEAVEEAADDDAVRADDGARLAFADTLVRVGRMAGEKPPAWMPVLALFDGDSLEKRVRRLLEPETTAVARTSSRLGGAVLVGMMLAIAAGAVAGSRPLHDAMEWAVRNLP